MTSTCQMSPVYHDTRVGRLLTEVDATLKCLWHGVCFPRDKRIKFAGRWRGIIEASSGNVDSLVADKESRNQLLAEFISAGEHIELLSVRLSVRLSLSVSTNPTNYLARSANLTTGLYILPSVISRRQII